MEISWKKILNELCGDYYEQLSNNLDKAKRLPKEIKELIRVYQPQKVDTKKIFK